MRNSNEHFMSHYEHFVSHFVSFDQARELKELGFDEPCFRVMNQMEKLINTILVNLM